MNILSSLNPKQKEAVTIIGGPVLVIAGPGSGKTKCLTHRIAYLAQQDVSPANILAVTFTNKAADEMRQRVSQLIKPLPFRSMSDIGTFHATCLRILRHQIDKLPGYYKNFVIYDQADQINLIKKTLKELKISTDQFKPNIVNAMISRAKDELIDVKKYTSQTQEYYPETIARIYRAYQTALKKANALDFDDLIMLTVELFKKNPALLEQYQDKWPYIMVDEAHDTNYSQYVLINLLAQKHKNLWLIADTDQSIYSWRGADYRNILNFEKDYPKAKIVILEQNYRSTKNIILASHHIISKNSQRKEKNLWTENPTGDLINIVQTENEEQEGTFIIEEIENLTRRQGLTLKDFTVLYRTNAQSRAIEEAFLKANFPYKIIGTVRFYERKEIKDILAYLKYIANKNDLISLQRIINTPTRRLARFAKNVNKLYLLKDCPTPLNDFYNLIDNLRKVSQKDSLAQLIRTILNETEYQNYIKKSSRDEEEGERRWENIGELITVASKYNKYRDGQGLEKFLEEITLLTNHDEVETNKNLVNLMTVHCAKGLESPVVFIIGCEEGIFPHSKSLFSPEQMEEERRLCYVGITRAKQRAYLTFAQRRRLWGQTIVNAPSRFLADIPEDLIDFEEYI
tara:strand:+ start:1512 stop:3395 length:1884 start_codon:yes stop_codon:yes gene_type:complete